MEKVTMKPHFKRRKGISSLMTRSGGPLSVMVMGITLGGLLLLLFIQGSFFMPNHQHDQRHVKINIKRMLKGKDQWETQRQHFLQLLRTDQKHNLCHYITAKQKSQSSSSSSSAASYSSSSSSLSKNIWMQYIGAILDASRHVDDPNYLHEGWTKHLLSELPPSLLQQTLYNNPQVSSSQVSRILEIIRRRLKDENEPPLKIAVVGGAFAAGEGCNIASVAIPEGSIMANPSYCAWPYRLEGFLNSLLLGPQNDSTNNNNNNDGNHHHHHHQDENNNHNNHDSNKHSSSSSWVQVTNLAEEGTDTGFMTPLLRNWIYPQSLLPDGPDIIINAYGRHDYGGRQNDNNKIVQSIQSEMNTFLRAITSSHPCGEPPIVIHMDDVGVQFDKNAPHPLFSLRYFPALSRAIKADQQHSTTAATASTSSASFHHSPDFSMAAHMAMTWTLAFGALQVVLDHCQSEQSSSSSSLSFLKPSTALKGNKNKFPIHSLQPHKPNCQDPSSTGNLSCPFAFFAGPSGTVRRVTEFQKYIRPYIQTNRGWQVLSDMSTGWSRKTALVAISPEATILFRIPNITRPVQYFHIMTLKSNVEPWKDGKARFRVAILPPKTENNKEEDKKRKKEDNQSTTTRPMETSFVIDGQHEGTEEHITHHFNIDFEDAHKAPVGSDIILSVELIEGTSFKVLGLMLCA